MNASKNVVGVDTANPSGKGRTNNPPAPKQ